MFRKLSGLFRSRVFSFLILALCTILVIWTGQAAFGQSLQRDRPTLNLIRNRQDSPDCATYLQRVLTTNHESPDFATVMSDTVSALRCLPQRKGVSTLRTSPTSNFVNFETSHVHPLDLTPDGRTLLAVNIGAHTLEVFNVINGDLQQRASIPVGLDPVTVRARTNSEAWVVNKISDSVSVIDLTRNAVIRTLSTDDEPGDVVFAGTPAKAFVSCSEPNRVLVYNLDNLGAAPQRVSLRAEEPRSMAVSGDGSRVYVAAFESGNPTTALNGRTGPLSSGAELGSNNVVSSTASPYGGLNPPPNNGSSFTPARNPALPNQISSIIVRKTSQGQWLDDNSRNWTSFVSGANAPQTRRVVGWDLPDRDVAIIDAQSLAVSYQSNLMNAVMAIAVNPATQQVTVVGTEARNQIRFEPNLRSDFIRVQRATFTPGAGAAISDLNPHLDYSVDNIPMAQRVQSIGDPRGIQWNQAGTRAYITGMGSNNLIVMGPEGQRLGRVSVGEGPTGVVLQEASDRAYVLNKFDASISIISLSQLQEVGRKTLVDPTPAVIKAGRPFLYNTHLTSGLGQASCASCHIDARTDRLAWDLGNPAGSIIGGIHNPMKGPMLTQSLQDIMRFSNLHWRGDRATLANFNPTFTDLQAADGQLSSTQMQALGDFLATIHFPPNPYRNLNNTLPTSLVLPNGVTANAVDGRLNLNSCLLCHLAGRPRSAVQSSELSQSIIPPAFHGFYKRFGYVHTDATASTNGFGYFHDGVDPLLTAARGNNLLAAIMTFDGPDNGLATNEERLDTHAAVGKQVTIQGAATTGQSNTLNQFYTIVNTSPHVGMVVRVTRAGVPQGYYYLGNNTFQTGQSGQTIARSQLEAFSAGGDAVTYLIVPKGTETQIFNTGRVFDTSSSNWQFCASENGTCTFSGTRRVRYGANGVYNIRTLTNQTVCNNSVFDDPVPGTLKGCEFETTTVSDWQFCANEGETCAFSGTVSVRYGANGQYSTQNLSNGTACSNTVFGDPVPGALKRCEIPASTSTWTVCAPENGTCSFTGTRNVRYGAMGIFNTRTLTNGTACNNTVFGDPVPGIAKQCEVNSTPVTVAWTFCANENQTCPFTGTRMVRYGANGVFNSQTLTGGAECNNLVFGDPVPGIAKVCELSLIN